MSVPGGSRKPSVAPPAASPPHRARRCFEIALDRRPTGRTDALAARDNIRSAVLSACECRRRVILRLCESGVLTTSVLCIGANHSLTCADRVIRSQAVGFYRFWRAVRCLLRKNILVPHIVATIALANHKPQMCHKCPGSGPTPLWEKTSVSTNPWQGPAGQRFFGILDPKTSKSLKKSRAARARITPNPINIRIRPFKPQKVNTPPK